MSEPPEGRRTLEVGTLSPDGSRRWDGRFWVLIRNDYPLAEPLTYDERRLARAPAPERRGFRLGGVIAAAAVGMLLTFVPIPAPPAGSINAALNELAFLTLVRSAVTFIAMVVILSVGRQGIDVLLLRAMLTAFLLGATFVGLFVGLVLSVPIPLPTSFAPRIPIAVLEGGLGLAVTLGPVLAAFATLANLIWYRSFHSLRPQIRIFNRAARS